MEAIFTNSVKDTLSIHDNQIDFKKLIEILRNGRLLTNVYYYNACLDRGHNEKVYWKQQKFFSELRKIPGFLVIPCNMRKTRKADGTFEFAVKGDDIHIATDILSSAYENKYDIAILVSGDGDFVPVIRKVQKLGKQVENAYFSVSRSNFLRKVCDHSILLDNAIKECVKEIK